MGLFSRKPNAYRDNDDYLHREQQKAMIKGDWEAYDAFSKRIKENNEAWAQNKSTRERFDKAGRGNIVAKILAICGVGATVGYMAYSEKHNGVLLSGTNGEVKKGLVGTVIGWLK